MEMGMRKI